MQVNIDFFNNSSEIVCIEDTFFQPDSEVSYYIVQ